MALDGIMLSAIKKDLNNTIIDGRIDKIYQVDENILTFTIRNNEQNYNLLLSIHPRYGRLQITKNNFSNPIKPPDFCMILRKYLMRGIIKKIEQPDFERIINITITLYDKTYNLFIEIMGKHSNIILVDQEGTVLDAMKRITPQISRERQLYPGIKYQYPPKQNKLNPLLVSRKDFFEKIPGDFNQDTYKAIMYNFRGIGPYSAREIVYRSDITPGSIFSKLNEQEYNQLWNSFNNIFTLVRKSQFCIAIGLTAEGNIKYLSAFPLHHLDLEYNLFKTTGEMLDYYYEKEIQDSKKIKIKNYLSETTDNYLQKNLKKQNIFKEQLKKGINAKQYKEKGELITANIYKLKRGMDQVEVVNYFDSKQDTIEIKLDPSKSPSENAQYYFKKYNKAKKSVKYLKKQLGKLRHEERYLEQVVLNIEQAETKQDLQEIKEELTTEGYIKEKKKRNIQKKKSNNSLPPYQFLSTQGYDILVGRNNRQNDHLTKKLANNQDLWLHVKEIAGSHVIIRNHTGDQIPDKTIREAAIIAAYYSKGRQSENVPVDYTFVKNVQKPKGAKPGLVYYDNHQTIYVTPDKNIIKKLKSN